MRVGDFTVMPVAEVTNFVLDHPGDYAALLEVDGTELARWRFRAIEAPDPAAGTQAGAGAAPPPEAGQGRGCVSKPSARPRLEAGRPAA